MNATTFPSHTGDSGDNAAGSGGDKAAGRVNKSIVRPKWMPHMWSFSQRRDREAAREPDTAAARQGRSRKRRGNPESPSNTNRTRSLP